MELLKNSIFATVIGIILYFVFGIGFIFDIFEKISMEPETLRAMVSLLITSIISAKLQK